MITKTKKATSYWQVAARREHLMPPRLRQVFEMSDVRPQPRGPQTRHLRRLHGDGRDVEIIEAVRCPQQGYGLARGAQSVRQVHQSSPWTSRAPCCRSGTFLGVKHGRELDDCHRMIRWGKARPRAGRLPPHDTMSSSGVFVLEINLF